MSSGSHVLMKSICFNVIQEKLTGMIHCKHTTQVKSVSEINVMQSQIREVVYNLKENCGLVRVLFYPRERGSIHSVSIMTITMTFSPRHLGKPW